jgi:hypothetical protein
VRRLHRRARAGERGAVAVEAAIVTPVIMLALIGIVEFSLALRDYVSVTSAVRTGARTATTNSSLLAGDGTCEQAGPDLPTPPPCSPASTPAFAQQAAAAIQQTGLAMPKDSIDYIFVYKANNKGYPGAANATTMPSSVAGCVAIGSCVAYTWQDSRDRFIYAGGSWQANTVNACPATADNVGVYMHATHKFVTHVFGASIGLGDRAVMRFEPLPTTNCAANVRPA